MYTHNWPLDERVDQIVVPNTQNWKSLEDYEIVANKYMLM